MEIKLLDKYSALIKGKKESVLINPSDDFFKKEKGSRIIIFSDDNLGVSNFLDERISIAGAGEYEIGGVEVWGSDVGDNKTIYNIKIDGVSVMFLGKLETSLSEKKIEKIEGIDVLVAPIVVDGKSSFKIVKDWAKKWGANYLVPIGGNGDEMKVFLDEADEEGLESELSLKVDKENLPDGLELKLLKIV